jgi:hypothetical protein
MAGLGYKDFTVGQVLTSAQVDGYLMQQTIMKFADASARTTALTGVLAEGMFSYLDDTNATEYYDGSAWVSISNPGDITAVVASTGLSGGGTSGSVSLAFDYSIGNQSVENAQTGTSYTLVLGDAGKMVTMTNASANTLTVPPNSSVAFPTNTRIDMLQYGAGQTTIAPGAGVTIYSSGSKLKLTGQYSGATLWKKATDTWVLVGDISA